MPNKKLALARLVAQGLVQPDRGATPAGIVSSFGAMQGQDLGVLSSVALRLPEKDIDAVIADTREHKLVRGYPIRTTVFLTAANDIRWITDLCSPNLVAWSRERAHKHFGITGEAFERVATAVVHHPSSRPDADGLTRAEIREIMVENLPDHDEVTAGHMYRTLFQLQIELVAVQSSWDGKAQRIFAAEPIVGPGLDVVFNGDREAGVTELLARYIRTRGPVTLRDFAWWSKLKLTEIRSAARNLPDDLEQIPAAGMAALGAEDSEPLFARRGLVSEVDARVKSAAKPQLLPGFDEFVLGYQDRLFAMTDAVHDRLVPNNRGVFLKSVVVDGTIRGSWTTTGGASRRRLAVTELATIPKAAEGGIRRSFAEFPFA